VGFCIIIQRGLNMEFNESVGKRVKEIRLLSKLTQQQFAEKIGLQWNKIKDIERGHNKLQPSIALLIEEQYSVDIRWLYSGKGQCLLSSENESDDLSFDPEILETAIETFEILLNKYKKHMPPKAKATAIRMLYEYIVLSESTTIEEKTMLKILKMAS